MKQLSFLLTDGAVFVAILGGVIVVAGIARPMNQLLDIANEIAEGKLNSSVDWSRFAIKGEMGRLAKAFQIMRNRLQQAFKQFNEGADRLDEAATQLATVAGQIKRATGGGSRTRRRRRLPAWKK